ADKDGHIAFVYNARFPVRERGWDWSAYLPGDRSSLVWNSTATFEDIPTLVDPTSGVVGNANHSPFAATVGDENLQPEDFPSEWGIEKRMTNRGHRFLELWGADESITHDEMVAYKFDHSYSQRSETARVLRQLLALTPDSAPAGDARLEHALSLLRQWDLDTQRQNRSAALAVLSIQKILNGHGEAAEHLRETLLDTYDELVQHFGRADPSWGDVNRLTRGSVNLPVSGAPDVLRAIYGAVQDDGTLNATNGDGFMALVEWDQDGGRRAWGLHQYGAHVADPSAKHATDQMQDFVDEELRPILLTQEEINAAAQRTYSP
ncbi:MAG: penicillin acylase family protein, partial [Myxococcota bacterium]